MYDQFELGIEMQKYSIFSLVKMLFPIMKIGRWLGKIQSQNQSMMLL